MTNEYWDRILQIIKEAGQIALRYRDDSAPDFKPDKSIITQADKDISRLAQEHLKDFLKRPGHILIDEEDQDAGRYLNAEVLKNTSYIFAIDPIDGTRAYANRWPHFGISIGVIKDLKPWLGAVYFPVLRELFYCDGDKSYFVQNAFNKNEIKRPITPIDQTINKLSIFLLTDSFFKRFEWDFTDCHIMIPACAVVDLCWPTIGRACGAIMKSYLWDFAGSWPILHSAGLALRSLASDKELREIHVDDFVKEKTLWKLKEHYIISSARNFPILKNKIKSR